MLENNHRFDFPRLILGHPEKMKSSLIFHHKGGKKQEMMLSSVKCECIFGCEVLFPAGLRYRR